MLRTLSFVVLALALLGPALPAQALCPAVDDGFNLGCCTLPQPNIPSFPTVTELGIYACYQNCVPVQRWRMSVTVSAPQLFLCDTALITMTASSLTPGGPTLTGRFIAKYSRTWISTFNGCTQVWRFLLNGDWSFGPAVSLAGCPAPVHGDPVHAIGSIDYGMNPASGAFVGIALNLSHLPGCFSHGFDSVRPLGPGLAHNDRSYHLVAPRDFVYGTASGIDGNFSRDAVRPARVGNCFPNTYTCITETRVVDGTLRSIFKNCLCTNLNGGPWVHQSLSGRVDCNGIPGAFKSVSNVHPSLPTGLAALRLGTYTDATVFPGEVEVNVYVGYLVHADPCGLSTDADLHRVFGVGTLGTPGYHIPPPIIPGPPIRLFKAWVDLADSLIPSNTPGNPIPVPSPILPVPCVSLVRAHGAPAYSSFVWQLNPE